MNTLTAVQEHAYISAVQFNTPQAVESLDILILTFQPIIKHLSKKLSSDPFIREDLYQEGVLGLIEAIKSFDLSTSYRLSTFAFYRVRGKMKDWLRKEYRNLPILNDSTFDAEDNCGPFGDSFADDDFYIRSLDKCIDKSLNPEDIHLQQELSELFIGILMKLPPRQRSVIYLAFWMDRRPSEIADAMKVSRPRITKLLSAGLRGCKRQVLQTA